MMGKSKSKIRTWLYLSIAAVVSIIVVSIIFIIINSKKNVTLEVLVAPISAEVKINGKVYKNGIYKFEPGEVSVIIEKEGFKTEEQTLELVADTTEKLYRYLMPLDGKFDWYLEHEEDMMILNTIGDSEASVGSRNYLEKYPIAKSLPIIYANYDDKWNYTEFRIDGGEFVDCSVSFCLKITDTTGDNYERAVNLIIECGYSPDDYEILYEYRPVIPLN